MVSRDAVSPWNSNRNTRKVLAKQINEMPKWSARIVEDCGHMTADAPIPAWRKREPTIRTTRTLTSRRPRCSARAPRPVATMRKPSTPVTARWLNSIAVSTAYSGMNSPWQSGQERPQPSPDPVSVTVEPMIRTRNIPIVASTPTRLTAVSIRPGAPRPLTRLRVYPGDRVVCSDSCTSSALVPARHRCRTCAYPISRRWGLTVSQLADPAQQLRGGNVCELRIHSSRRRCP